MALSKDQFDMIVNAIFVADQNDLETISDLIKKKKEMKVWFEPLMVVVK